jgi:hypothetical protein
MKPIALIGIILIVAGIAGFALGTFNYSEDKTVLNIGDLHATTKEEHQVPLKEASGVAVIAGIVLVVVGYGRKS